MEEVTRGMPADAGQAKRLKQARRALKLTQLQMAESLNMSPSGYRNYEAAVFPIAYRKIRAMADQHGINPQWLKTGQGEMIAPKAKASAAVAPLLDDLHTQFNAITDRAESSLRRLGARSSAANTDSVAREFDDTADRADSGPLVQWMPSPGELFHARGVEGDKNYSQCVLRCVARDAAAVIADRVWSEYDYGQKRQIISTHIYSFHQVGVEVAAALGLTPQ